MVHTHFFPTSSAVVSGTVQEKILEPRTPIRNPRWYRVTWLGCSTAKAMKALFPTGYPGIQDGHCEQGQFIHGPAPAQKKCNFEGQNCPGSWELIRAKGLALRFRATDQETIFAICFLNRLQGRSACHTNMGTWVQIPSTHRESQV